MTFMPEDKPYKRLLQCECGQIFKNNTVTTKCGMCTIADMLADPKEIAAVIYYVVSKSDIQDNDLKQITRDLLKDNLPGDLIELGLEDECINKINLTLSSNTPKMKYTIRNLAELLKEYNNIFHFIKILLKRFNYPIDTDKTSFEGKNQIDQIFELTKKCPKCKKTDLTDKDKENILFKNECISCSEENKLKD